MVKHHEIMISGADFESLTRENEFLKGQLEELEYILKLREEEIDILRQKNNEIQRQQVVGMEVQEMEEMQKKLEDAHRKQEAVTLRWKELERELMASIALEIAYLQTLDQMKGLQAQSELMQIELQDAWQTGDQLKQTQQQLVEIRSQLEISETDRDVFKEALEACKSANPA